jgi:hypothetical protein
MKEFKSIPPTIPFIKVHEENWHSTDLAILTKVGTVLITLATQL